MIISYEGHHPIKVSDGKVTFIKVANSAVYRDFILSFQGKSDKVKFFDEHYNQLEKNKFIDWVGDVLITQDCLNSYLTKIISNLFENISEKHRNRIFDKWRQLSTDIQDIIFMTDLFKFDGIHFDDSVLSDPYAIIETVVKIHIECKLNSVVTFANVSHYLTKEQLNNLITFVKEVNVPLILMEFSSLKFQVDSGVLRDRNIDDDVGD